jgi:hypothetical protein
LEEKNKKSEVGTNGTNGSKPVLNKQINEMSLMKLMPSEKIKTKDKITIQITKLTEKITVV